MNHTMDSCNFLSGKLRTASGAFTQIGLLLMGGLPFENCLPSLFVCDFGVGDGERALAPRLP